MPRKTTPKSTYTKRAAILRKLGYKVTYRGNRKSTPGQHAAVTNLWNDKAVFYATNPDPNNLDFHKWGKKYRRKDYEGVLAPDQIYPDGFYIQRPGSVGRGKYTLTKDGDGIRLRASGLADDLIIRLDLPDFLKRQHKALEAKLKGLKRPRQFLLNVNGFDTGAEKFSDLEQFNRYLNENLIPDLHASGFDFGKWGRRVFGLKLVYTPKGRKKAPEEGTDFDFKTGSIFSGRGKKVYGKKRFYKRSENKQRKERRKGK